MGKKNAQGKEAKIEASTPVTKIAGDPHTWVSPKEAILEVQYIADQLSNVFPQYKSDFEKKCLCISYKIKKNWMRNLIH